MEPIICTHPHTKGKRLCRACRDREQRQQYAQRNRVIADLVETHRRTLEDIGKEYGLTRERIRAIHRSIYRKEVELMPPTKRFDASLPMSMVTPEIRDAVLAIAEAEGKSVSHVIRQAVEEMLARRGRPQSAPDKTETPAIPR